MYSFSWQTSNELRPKEHFTAIGEQRLYTVYGSFGILYGGLALLEHGAEKRGNES